MPWVTIIITTPSALKVSHESLIDPVFHPSNFQDFRTMNKTIFFIISWKTCGWNGIYKSFTINDNFQITSRFKYILRTNLLFFPQLLQLLCSTDLCIYDFWPKTIYTENLLIRRQLDLHHFQQDKELKGTTSTCLQSLI